MAQHVNYIISTSLNGHINDTPLAGFTKLTSEPGTIYSLIDANTNKTPQGLKFHQEQNILIVEYNGKRILALKGFFSHKENPAKFVVDKADGTAENIITADAIVMDEDGRAYIIASEPLLVANSELNTTNPVAPEDTTAEPEPDFLTDNWVWFAVGGAIILAGVAAGGSNSSSGKKDSSTDKPKPDEPDAGMPTLESIKATGNTIMLTYNEALDGDHLPEASTFAIQVIGGANNPVTTVAISDSGDAIILTLTNPIAKGSNFTIAYTYPTTGDDTNAIQDEQGNDASTFNGKTGLVVDGYIQGAQLYADYDNNGIAEDDEILEGVITDEFGRFFLPTDINAPLIAVGGTNTDTGIENTLTMRAPEGATVINPITTVVQQYLNDNEGTSLEQAETAVKEILGITLPANESLSDYEPISSKNQEMQEIAAQIVEVAMQAETTKSGDGSTVFENIAATKTPLDLTTADDVTAITKGTGITAETVQALVAQTTNIKDTDSIAEIATQQKSLIVALTDDTGLEDDDLNSSVGTIEVTRKFTGNIQYSINDGVIWTDNFDAEEGDNNLQVRQVDAEGKVLSAITTFAFILDSTAPTIVITDNTEDAAIGDVTYSFTFSEAVMGFAAGDITVSGGSKGLFSKIDGRTYQLVVTPATDSTTPITVDVKAGVVTDIAGNANTAAEQSVQQVQVVDPARPTVVISKELDSGYPETSGLGFYFIKFSEDVRGFRSEDLTIIGGNIYYFRQINDVTYRLVVAQEFDRTEPVTIGIKADVAKDADGDGNYAAVPLVVKIYSETLVVTEVKISDDTGSSVTDLITKTASQTITANLDKPLAEGERLRGSFGDINGGLGTDITDHVEGTKISWKVDLFEGNNEIVFFILYQVRNEDNPDISPIFEALIGSTPINYTLDTTAPTVAITDSGADPATGAVAYTFTFSEDVFGLTADSIEVTGGAKGTLKIIGDNTYTLTVTPLTGSTTPITAVVKEDGSITDIAGNKFDNTIDRSIVIFDLTTGKSSTHSDRKFTDEVTDIYIIVHAEPSKLELDTEHRWWSSDGKLTAGIKVHMIASEGGKAITTVGGDPIDRSVKNSSYIAYTGKGHDVGGVAMTSKGRFVQEIEPNVNTVTRLWVGNVVLTKGSFGGTIASGVLTSQGFA